MYPFHVGDALGDFSVAFAATLLVNRSLTDTRVGSRYSCRAACRAFCLRLLLLLAPGEPQGGGTVPLPLLLEGRPRAGVADRAGEGEGEGSVGEASPGSPEPGMAAAVAEEDDAAAGVARCGVDRAAGLYAEVP